MTIKLCCVDIDSEYKNVINFKSKAEQESYFNSLLGITYYDVMFYKSEKNIAIDLQYSQALKYNYCIIFDGERYFYNFIIDCEMQSEESVIFTLKLDVFNTYFKEFEVKNAFIEREHKDRFKISDMGIERICDEIDENLDIGDDYVVSSSYKLCQTSTYANNIKNLICVMFLSKTRLDFEDFNGTNPYYGNASDYGGNGVPLPYFVYYVLVVDNNGNSNEMNYLGAKVRIGETTKRFFSMSDIMRQMPVYFPNDLIGIYATPYIPFKAYSSMENNDIVVTGLQNCELRVGDIEGFAIGFLPYFTDNEIELDYTLPSKNITNNIIDIGSNINMANIECESKLYSYPFSYYAFCNGKSNPVIYKSQRVDNQFQPLRYKTTISDTPVAKIYYKGYKGDRQNFDNILSIRLLDLPYISEKYEEYLRMNKASALTSILVPTVQSALGVGLIASGAGSALGGAMLQSGFGSIFNEMTKRQDLQNQPPSLRGNNNDAIFDLFNRNCYCFLREYRISDTIRNRIYQYFMRYGYASKRFTETINYETRVLYNYIKCADIDVFGDVSNSVKYEIANAFKNGITFWHTITGTPVIGDYSMENKERVLYYGEE